MTKGWGIWTIFSSEYLERLWFTVDFSANSWLSEIWIQGVPFHPRWYLFVESHIGRNEFCTRGLLGLAVREDWCLAGQLVQLSLRQLADLEPVPADPNCWTSNNCIAIPIAKRLASMKCCFLKKKKEMCLYIINICYVKKLTFKNIITSTFVYKHPQTLHKKVYLL